MSVVLFAYFMYISQVHITSQQHIFMCLKFRPIYYISIFIPITIIFSMHILLVQKDLDKFPMKETHFPNKNNKRRGEFGIGALYISLSSFFNEFVHKTYIGRPVCIYRWVCALCVYFPYVLTALHSKIYAQIVTSVRIRTLCTKLL